MKAFNDIQPHLAATYHCLIGDHEKAEACFFQATQAVGGVRKYVDLVPCAHVGGDVLDENAVTVEEDGPGSGG